MWISCYASVNLNGADDQMVVNALIERQPGPLCFYFALILIPTLLLVRRIVIAAFNATYVLVRINVHADAYAAPNCLATCANAKFASVRQNL